MSQILIEKIRRAREFKVEAGGWSFTCSRPTDADAVSTEEWIPLDVVKRFVVGWSLNQIDVIPGGDPLPATFTPELFAEWIVDHPELWKALAIPILDAYRKHAQAREVAEKN